MRHYYDIRLNQPLQKEYVEALGVPSDKLHTIGIYPVFNAVTEPSPYERTVGYEYGELRQDGKIAWYNIIEPISEKQQLEVAKSLKLTEINDEYTRQADIVKIGVPLDEILTWDIQRLEAQAWRKDNTVATPNVDKLALARGVDRVWLLGKILEKVDAYESYIFILTGKRQEYEDKIKAAKTREEVEAITWEVAENVEDI